MMTYEGLGTTASLDPEAQTITLIHHSRPNLNQKRRASPWVIQLGAIESVEWVEKSALKRGWFRLILRDRAGYDANQLADLNAFYAGKQKVGPFAEEVKRLINTAAPTDSPAPPPEAWTQRVQRQDREHAEKRALERAERAEEKRRQREAAEAERREREARDAERVKQKRRAPLPDDLEIFNSPPRDGGGGLFGGWFD